jgi:hypothetical protein
VIGGDGAAQGLTVRLGLSELYTEHPRQLVGFLAAKRIALRAVLLGDAAFTLRRDDMGVAPRDNQIKLLSGDLRPHAVVWIRRLFRTRCAEG